MNTESKPPKIIVPGEADRPAYAKAAPAGAWQVLAIVGWVFLAVGAMDVGLVWYPPAFGNPGWEFGSITTSLNGFPLPIMGTALILASAVARGNKLMARLAMAVAIVFILVIVASGILYALDVPLALKSVTDPLGRSGLKKAILRSLVQLVIYPTVLALAIWRSARLLKTGDVR